MDSCCQLAYNNTFDSKRALKEMGDYLTSGPKKSTCHLLDPLLAHVTPKDSLMDIGSGVGAIIWELLDAGIKKATYLDISPGYSQVFKDQIDLRGKNKPIQVETGDFTELYENITPSDIVTLDKVICCYEDYQPLVALSTKKCKRLYAYTIPRNVWWVKAVNGIGAILKSFSKNHLQSLVHSTSKIEELVLAEGFNKIFENYNREWLTVIYERAQRAY